MQAARRACQSLASRLPVARKLIGSQLQAARKEQQRECGETAAPQWRIDVASPVVGATGVEVQRRNCGSTVQIQWRSVARHLHRRFVDRCSQLVALASRSQVCRKSAASRSQVTRQASPTRVPIDPQRIETSPSE